jgi:hypothetical protein
VSEGVIHDHQIAEMDIPHHIISYLSVSNQIISYNVVFNHIREVSQQIESKTTIRAYSFNSLEQRAVQRRKQERKLSIPLA